MSQDQSSPDPTPAQEQSSLWTRVEGSASRVEGRLRDLQKTQRQTRNWLIIIALILAAQIAIFVLAGYTRVRNNFTPERLQAAAEQSFAQLAPEVSDELLRVSQSVAPVYREKLATRMEAIYPDLLDRTQSEFEELPQQIGSQAGDQMEQALRNVLTRLQPDLQETFPTIEESADVERFMTDFRSNAEEKLVATSQDMEGMLDVELQRVSDAFFEFDIAPTPAEDQPTLEQQLIHVLLQLLDRWVMATDPIEEVPYE